MWFRRWLAECYFCLIFTLKSMPIMWRVQNGRWYCFREAPDWLVKEWAATVIPADADDLFIATVRQAEAEFVRRYHRLAAEAEKQMEQAS